MTPGRFFRYKTAEVLVALCGVGHTAFLAFAALPWWLVTVSFEA